MGSGALTHRPEEGKLAGEAVGFHRDPMSILQVSVCLFSLSIKTIRTPLQTFDWSVFHSKDDVHFEIIYSQPHVEKWFPFEVTVPKMRALRLQDSSGSAGKEGQ